MKAPGVKLLSGDIYISRPAHKHSASNCKRRYGDETQKVEKQAHVTCNASSSECLV